MPRLKTSICLIILLLVQAASFALYTDGVRMPHKITRPNPDRGPTVAAGLDFSTTLRVRVDGIPVKVELPGSNTPEQIIKVTTHVDDPDEKILYEYNLIKKSVKMTGLFGERIYSQEDNPEMAYIMLERMMGIVRAAFVEIGLNFDPETEELSIDKARYADKIAPGLDLDVVNTEDKVIITIAVADEMASFTYDKKNRLFSCPKDIMFASGYDWDVAAGAEMALADDPYSGIGAAGVTETPISRLFKGKFIRLIPFTGQLIISSIIIIDQKNHFDVYANFKTQPMPRLPEPEITDVSWVDKAAGLVRIEGKGGSPGNPPKIYLTKGDGAGELSDGLSWGSDTWSVTNYSVRLNDGENKINAILRGTSNREVESGDVTVYKGTGDEPDLILLSPRDRQVVWHKNINSIGYNDLKTVIKGKASIGARVKVEGMDVDILQNGSFEETKDISLLEGNNNVTIVVLIGSSSISVNEKVIGAYEFVSNTKSKAYVLRRGDFVFDGNAPSQEGFDLIPYEPNHTGIYTGDGNVTEAVQPNWYSLPKVIKRDLQGNWNNEKFYYATQVPKLVGEDVRKEVAELIEKQEGKPYEIPIHFGKREEGFIFFIEGGQYTPDNDMFYCSELAYWGWEMISAQKGFDFGISRKDTMFPILGYDNPDQCSILPAFLCEKSMGVKKVAQ